MTAINDMDILDRIEAELNGMGDDNGETTSWTDDDGLVTSVTERDGHVLVSVSDDEGTITSDFEQVDGMVVETVTETGPDNEEAEIREAQRPMRYDLVMGMVPADLDDDQVVAWLTQQRAERDAAEREAERAALEEAAAGGDEDAEAALRQAIIDDQMATSQAQQGTATWAQELRRREHERAIKESALTIAQAIRDYLGSYLVFPTGLRDAQLDVMTMWAIHTYTFRAQGVTPYLAVTAPTQGSGKTTVLELLSTLASNPSKVEVNPTAPVVRVLCDEGRTVFLDEIDTLSSDKAFVATMNSGYKAGGSITRIGRRKGDNFAEVSSTFAPKAIAGIAREGTLPLPTATLDRCIEIKIVRAKPGELSKRFRVEVMRDETEVTGMRDWMASWTASMRTELRDAYVDLPRLSTSRAEQIWEPLVTIAHLLGGDWYDRICKAATLMDGGREQNVDPNAALVADVATVVEAYTDMCPDATQIKIDDLMSLRNVLVGRKLRDKLTAEQVAKRLGAFGIRAEVLNMDGTDAQVYTLLDDDGMLLSHWVDLFSRYSE